jgi:hypothetical protein
MAAAAAAVDWDGGGGGTAIEWLGIMSPAGNSSNPVAASEFESSQTPDSTTSSFLSGIMRPRCTSTPFSNRCGNHRQRSILHVSGLSGIVG